MQPCARALIFYQPGTHNVQVFPDQTAFDACDFTGAAMIKPNKEDGMRYFMVPFDAQSGAMLLFGDSKGTPLNMHCADQGLKTSVEVNLSGTPAPSTAAPPALAPTPAPPTTAGGTCCFWSSTGDACDCAAQNQAAIGTWCSKDEETCTGCGAAKWCSQ